MSFRFAKRRASDSKKKAQQGEGGAVEQSVVRMDVTTSLRNSLGKVGKAKCKDRSSEQPESEEKQETESNREESTIGKARVSRARRL